MDAEDEKAAQRAADRVKAEDPGRVAVFQIADRLDSVETKVRAGQAYTVNPIIVLDPNPNSLNILPYM